MGWFDEQIRQRIQHDDEAFCMAMAGMADVIMDQKLAAMLADDRIQTQNAIEEILKYYHIKPRDVPDTIADLNDQLEFLMRPSGIMRRRVQLKGEWYKEAIGPMLGAWKEDGRAAALIPGKQDEYLFLDETGRKTRITAKNAKEFASEAICFYRPLPSGEIHIPDLLKYMVSCLSASDWIFTACAAGAAALIGMLVPYINQLIYGRVIESQSLQLLFAIAGFLICVTVSQTMMETVKTILLARISTKLEIQVQAAGMMRLLSLPASFFKDYAAGDLAGRMNYLTLLCSSLTNTVLTSGLTAIFSLVYIVQMIQYGPGLAGPGLIVILFTICFSLITTLIQARVSRRTMEASVKESGLDYAFISGVQKIKLAGAEKRAFSKWAQAYTKVAKLTYDPPMILKISPVVTTSLSLIGTIVIYYAAIKNGTALADYFAFNSAYAMVTGAFSALVTVASLIAQVQPILGMLEPILQTAPEVEASKSMVSRLSGAVELNNVSFRYRENMPLIADNLSLKIRPGQYVAIVGKTGCGKSTLMRLLLGFETPQKGAIYYDGKDLSSMDLKSLRQHIGTVMQDGKLFQGDIYSNIVITAPQLSLEDAWQAAEMAGIADDIRHMPMGMHTLVSEGSGGISGGQRQRLLIARAIAPKPRILMFDEATSALDNLTQKTVSDSLASLKCTRIVIAHRLSTIKECDRILVLDQGHIVEDGTYEELIRQNGFFAELVARQQLEPAG